MVHADLLICPRHLQDTLQPPHLWVVVVAVERRVPLLAGQDAIVGGRLAAQASVNAKACKQQRGGCVVQGEGKPPADWHRGQAEVGL